MRYLVPLGFLLASTTCVAAADFGGPPAYDGSLKDGPALVSQPSWTGLYVGGHVGWATGGWDGRTVYTDPKVGPIPQIWDDPSRSIDGDGWLGGAQVGFNLQSGAFVYGIEADVSWADLDDATSNTTNGVDDSYTWGIKAKMDAFGTVRARLGYLVSPGFLLYGTGGFAWAKTSADLTVTHTWLPDPNASLGVTARGSADETHTGWAAGAGAEILLASNWTVRGEWLHIDLGEENYNLTGATVPAGNPHTTDSFPASLEFDVFRLGVNYKFGQ